MGVQPHIKHPHLYMTMSLKYLATQLDRLEVFGFQRSEALTILDLSEDELTHPKDRIDVARVEKMYEHAEKALNDPFIGLRVGYKFRVHDYLKTGSVYSYCDNIAQVLELNGRYQCLTVDVGQSEYRIENERHFFLYHHYQDAKAMRHVLGMIFGAWTTAIRWLSWADAHDLKEVHFTRDALEDISFYQEVVQCPIHFGMERNHVEFHSATLTKPLITRDPEKLAHSVSILDELLNRGNESENFKAMLMASIQAAMTEGHVSLAIVATRMNMSERQLRNRLSDHKLSFRDMLEHQRKDCFRQLHQAGESFASIAQALAYNDQAAFNRAFKRWYNTSPTQYTALKPDYK